MRRSRQELPFWSTVSETRTRGPSPGRTQGMLLALPHIWRWSMISKCQPSKAGLETLFMFFASP